MFGSPKRTMIIRRGVGSIIVILTIWAIIILAIYGAVQLWNRNDRISQEQVYTDTINQQQQRIIELERRL